MNRKVKHNLGGNKTGYRAENMKFVSTDDNFK